MLKYLYMNNTYFELKSRSLIKALVWRIIATLLTLSVVYLFTGKLLDSFKITIIAATLSTIAYYIHERIWNNIRWGRHY